MKLMKEVAAKHLKRIAHADELNSTEDQEIGERHGKAKGLSILTL